MRHTRKPATAAQRPLPTGDTARDHRPHRHWAATVGTLVLGVTIGAIAGMTSRTTRSSPFDHGFDDGMPPPAPSNPPTDAGPAPTGDDHRDSVADDDGWPRAH